MENETNRGGNEKKPSPWGMVLKVIVGLFIGILCWAAALLAVMIAASVSQGNAIAMTAANVTVALFSCWAVVRFYKNGYVGESIGVLVAYLVPYIGISLSMGSCIGWH